MSEMFVEIKGVCKSFDAIQALDHVDFSVKTGEVHCLIGQNGCGKSTLIKILSGVHQGEGDYSFKIKDCEIKQYNAREAMNRGIQVIYQDLSLFPQMSVAENISYIVAQQKKGWLVNSQEQRKVAKHAMEMMEVNLPLDELVENLSIANRQLVAMCRALATDAELLIMDEPTSSLTKKEIRALFKAIKSLKEKGISLIFVSHKLDEIVEIADRVTVLRDGVVTGTFCKDEIDIYKMAYYISGQNIEYQKPGELETEETVMKVSGLSRNGEFSDISFELHRGEVLGIVGLLGAGRSELALALFGMNPADAGTIEIEGKQAVIRNVKDAMKYGIAYLPEDRLLQGGVLDQSVEMNVTLTVLEQIKNKLGLIDQKKSRKLTEGWIESLRIKCDGAQINFRTLSGGNQQKIVLAKWLAINPKILILDEPTNGVDIAAKSAIYQVIQEFTKKGLSVILISSEVPEIYHNCHRIIVMKNGRFVGKYRTDEITEEEVNEFAVSGS